METRILVPHGLRMVVKDAGGELQSEQHRDNIKSSVFGDNVDEDNEEKPSSSSGHCETSEEPQQKSSKDRSKASPAPSSNDDEGSSLWKKQYRDRGQPKSASSSSSSSLSPTSSDSSSSENEAEVEYFMKNCRKSSDNLIGSSSNPFEYRKFSSSTSGNKESEKMSSQSQVKICAARVIEKGTVFTPNDGDVQVAYLKGISAIPKDDIRFIFGCFETISPISISPPPSSSCGSSDPLISPASTTTTATSPPLPDEKGSSNCNFMRLCNWIRFLRRTGTLKNISHGKPPASSSSQKLLKVCTDDSEENAENKRKQNTKERTNFHTKKSISDCPNFTNDSSKISFLTTATATGSEKNNNIIARFIDGRPAFQVTERLVPGTELIAYFDINSFLNHTSATSPSMPKMMSSMPTMTMAATAPPFQPVNISPPATYSSSSTRTISSSSSSGIFGSAGSSASKANNNAGFGGGGKKDRDERDLLQQHYQRQLSLFHHAFHNHHNAMVGENNVLFKDTQEEGNPFPSLWQSNLSDARFSRKEDDGKKRETFTQGGITDGPLDLSKFPVFGRAHEPLKVGTPFDSPDSNDDDMVKSSPSPVAESESGGSSLFSIKNVLKPQATGSPSKLFQPYSLEIGKKSDEREALMNAFITKNCSNTSGPLVTPPSSSDDPLSMRNSSGLRPILRTRGRERSLLPCEVCGKAFDRPSLLKRHLRTHTGEKPHICDVCSKGFSTSSSLNTHRRIHSGEKPHQCPICGKRFTASSNLYYHRMTHNKEKPHKCMLCGKSFPTPGDLKSHQYVHSGSWPYTCPVCHRGFSKQTNLRNHLLLHSGMNSNATSNKAAASADKQHTCQVCDKKFAQACNLRAHIKTHEETDSATSSCSICKRTFLSTSDMLLGGRCRNCLLSLSSGKSSTAVFSRNQRDSTSSSPIATPSMNASAANEKGKEGFTTSAYDVPSLLSHRMVSSIGNASQQPLAPSLGHLGLPLSQFSGLTIPGLSSTLQFSANAPGGLHFPMNGNHPGSNAADLFVNAGTTPPTRNALLEQLVEWNYRMAKESVGIGSLGFSLMQQKLLESRMLAAQLMNTHGFGMNGGMQDILGLRSTMSSEAFPSLDPVVPGENKFMQR